MKIHDLTLRTPVATTIRLEVNAGFAAIAQNAKTTDKAVRQASMALSQARKSARLFEVYGPHCELRHVDKRKLVRELEQAVEVGELWPR